MSTEKQEPWDVAADDLAKLDKPVGQGFAKPSDVFGTFQYSAAQIVKTACLAHTAALTQELNQAKSFIDQATDEFKRINTVLTQENERLRDVLREARPLIKARIVQYDPGWSSAEFVSEQFILDQIDAVIEGKP